MQKNIKVSGIKWDADDINDVKDIPADMTIQIPDHIDLDDEDDHANYCVTAVFADEPDANHTKWFASHEDAMAYIETLGDDANAAVGKFLSLEIAQGLAAEGTEVCFIFDDGTESVYEGGDIDEMYVGLPLATYTFVR